MNRCVGSLNGTVRYILDETNIQVHEDARLCWGIQFLYSACRLDSIHCQSTTVLLSTQSDRFVGWEPFPLFDLIQIMKAEWEMQQKELLEAGEQAHPVSSMGSMTAGSIPDDALFKKRRLGLEIATTTLATPPTTPPQIRCARSFRPFFAIEFDNPPRRLAFCLFHPLANQHFAFQPTIRVVV
jgi:hypothetical protein